MARQPKKRGCLGTIFWTVGIIIGGIIAMSIILGLIATFTGGPEQAASRNATLEAQPTQAVATQEPTATAASVLPASPEPTSLPTDAPAPSPTRVPSDTAIVPELPPAATPAPATATPVPSIATSPPATATVVVVLADPIVQAVDVAAPGMVVTSWNVGLDNAELSYIADQVAAFEGVDLWLIQEARGAGTVNALTQAAGVGEDSTFASVAGTTGADIVLMTIYDTNRFELLGWEELHNINTTGNARAPLVLHLLDSVTGVEFLAVNNHLYRSREEERDLQATLLNQWALGQTLPMIAGGDYNFDYDVPDGPEPEDRGFDNMTAGDVWRWVQPVDLIPSQCTDNLPCTYDDILDFIFVAGPAKEWEATSEIIVREGDFPDDAVKSDHRPLVAVFGAASGVELASRESVVEIVTASANGNANLRSGPGTEFPVAGSVASGEALDITGVNAAGDWYQTSAGMWIAAFLVNNAPDRTLLSVAQPAPAAVATIPPTTAPVVAAPVVVAPVVVAPSSSSSGSSEPSATVTPLPQASSSLVVTVVNPEAEYAVIQNTGASAIDLRGWILRSERGVQDCPLQGVIEPGATLTISALGDVAGFNCGFTGNIWNNSEPDAAVLISPDGLEVSRRE